MKDHNNDYYISYFILIIALLWLCLFQQCINGNKLEDIRHEIRIKKLTNKGTMRTIKFRGKCTDDGMWRHGDLLHADNLIWINDNGLHCTVDEKTVGQFTGLHDKNGEEIYEGDIIKCGGCKPLLEVRFVRGVFYFLWSGDLDNEFPPVKSRPLYAEVVGNIHDNPELLSRSKHA